MFFFSRDFWFRVCFSLSRRASFSSSHSRGVNAFFFFFFQRIITNRKLSVARVPFLSFLFSRTAFPLEQTTKKREREKLSICFEYKAKKTKKKN